MKDFYKCKYGMFIHHILPGARYADGTSVQTIDEMADAFDTEGFADSLVRMGVEYIIYTAWHFAVQPLYPSAVSEKWRPGNCPKRDLLGDIIDSVHARGIHVFFYTHPRDGHDFCEDDKEKTGWGRGKHENDDQQPCYDTFDYDRWNEYMIELYTELAERYAARLTGFYTDSNGPKDPSNYLCPPKDHQVVNYLRIRSIMKSHNPALITFQNYYGDVFTQDYGNSETYTGFISSCLKNRNAEKWHCTKKVATTLLPFGWLCAPSRDVQANVSMDQYDIIRYTMFNGSCSECGNVLFGAGTFAEGNLWSVGVEESMMKLKNVLSRFRVSFMDALPSHSYPTMPGSTLEKSDYRFWMTDENSEYEYLHCMQMPEDGILEFDMPEDGINLENPVLMTGEGSVALLKMNVGYRLIFTGTPDELDTVIRFHRTGTAISCGYEWINNTDKRIAYHGNWYYNACWVFTQHMWLADGCYEREMHCSYGTDSSLYLSFDGSIVELYGVLNEEGGMADVYIDGIFCGTIDQQSSERRAHALCFRSINLYGGRHVLQVYVKDDKKFIVDAVKVIK